MDPKELQIASLPPDALQKLQALEAELGKVVVAYTREPRLARLDEEQLHKLQQLEVELGVYLLAFENR